jgi:hypothetical protein
MHRYLCRVEAYEVSVQLMLVFDYRGQLSTMDGLLGRATKDANESQSLLVQHATYAFNVSNPKVKHSLLFKPKDGLSSPAATKKTVRYRH